MLCSQRHGKAGGGEALVLGAHLFCRQQLVSQVKLVSICALLLPYCHFLFDGFSFFGSFLLFLFHVSPGDVI